jgi:hypothetical protein
MKRKLQHILAITCFALLGSVTVSFAQEANASDYDVMDNEREKLEKERILYSPGEGESRYIPKAVNTTTNPKDSASVSRPAAPVAVPARMKTEAQAKEQPTRPHDKQHPPKDDDSIMSFNFLYYIIQKYKLQDIVD